MKKNESIQVPDDEIDKIIDEVDFAGNGQINYHEFLAATVQVKDVMSNARLYTLFQQFDTDGSETITKENLTQAFKNMGKKLNNDEIEKILEEHDLAQNGVLDFEEFKTMF